MNNKVGKEGDIQMESWLGGAIAIGFLGLLVAAGARLLNIPKVETAATVVVALDLMGLLGRAIATEYKNRVRGK